MRSIVYLTALIVGMCLSTSLPLLAAPDSVTVLVPPLENLSGVSSMTDFEIQTGSASDGRKRVVRVDRYSEASRGYLEDLLLKHKGIKVVERQRVDTMLLESEFVKFRGLVDQEQASKLGGMLGARHIVMGSILSLEEKKRNFSGYGIKSQISELKCEIRVRIIEIKSGNIVFSTTVSDTNKLQSSDFNQRGPQAGYFELIKSSLLKINDDPSFKEAVLLMVKSGVEEMSAKANQVEIKINPIPVNCDVEIDGQYVGSSPLSLRVEREKKTVIKISKQGYEPWEKSIKAVNDLQVTPELRTIQKGSKKPKS